MGDLKEIMLNHEKTGSLIREQTQIAIFRDVVDVCKLEDLRYSGQHFTWLNRQSGFSIIQERLDRTLANQE